MAHIVYAGDGVGNGTVDASEAIARFYAAGQREFAAGNDLGDPAPGEKKYLFIVWAQGSVLTSGVAGEGDDQPIVIP